MKFEVPKTSPEERHGNRFLKERYDLHTSPEVARTSDKIERLSGEYMPQDPTIRIQAYIDRWKQIVYPEDPTQRERNIETLKRNFHEQYILKKENLPETYFETKRRIAEERGEAYPDEISEEMRHGAYEEISKNQMQSLDYWIDYLASAEAQNAYPDWAKHWAFRSVLGLGEYDKKTHTFKSRTEETTSPFPDLNQEALTYAISYLVQYQNGEYIENPLKLPDNPYAQDEDKAVSDADFVKLLSTKNFARYYAFALEHLAGTSEKQWEETRGTWHVFPKGSDPVELVKTLQGRGTGWCTAGIYSAWKQLGEGDVHIYYSLDKLGAPTVPRLAIRFKDAEIIEVGGVASKQDIDPYIGNVLEAKIQEFGTAGLKYQERIDDMRYLTSIDAKIERQEDLTNDELIFLYELKKPIKSFGLQKNPRIERILSHRDPIADLNRIFTENSDWHGDLLLGFLEKLDGISLPHTVSGLLDLHKIRNLNGTKLPERIDSLDLRSLEELHDPLPHIMNDITLAGLRSATKLEFPDEMRGGINLSNLQKVKTVHFPKKTEGNISLSNLKEFDAIIFPEEMTGIVSLGIESVSETLVLPRKVFCLYMPHIRSAQGITFPQEIQSTLDLSSLETIEGLELPQIVKGRIIFKKLSDIDKDALRNRFPHLARQIA